MLAVRSRCEIVGPGGTDGPIFDSFLTLTPCELEGGTTALTLVHERLDELAAAMPHGGGNVRSGWELALDEPSGTVA